MLDRFIAKYFPEPAAQPKTNGHATPSGAARDLGDEEIISLCRKAKNAAKFASLFDDGDTARYDGDDSAADCALLGILAFYTADPEQLDRLYRKSALMRPKWDERRGSATYGQRTIDYVNEHTEERYSRNEFISFEHKDEVANETKALVFKTARQVAAETPAEVEWIVRPWLAKGAITEIDGKVKAAGKTTFVSHKVACIVDGKPFMGEPTTKTKVVWLTEQTPATFRKVLERASLTDRDDVVVVHWHDAIGIGWEDVAALATEKALEIGAGVLVVDTLGQFAGIRGDGENNAGAAQEAMQPLQEAAAKGLAVEFTRHERKGGGEVGESGRGSSAFGGAVDVIMSIRRGDGNTRPTVRIIEALSRFDETPDKVVVELTDRGYRNLGDASAFAEQEAMKAIVEVVPAKPEHAIRTDDLLDKLKEQDIKRTVAVGALAKLTAAGTISRLGEGKRGNPYRYYKPTTEDPPGDSESPDLRGEKDSFATSTYSSNETNMGPNDRLFRERQGDLAVEFDE
jgi:hypothetical protein